MIFHDGQMKFLTRPPRSCPKPAQKNRDSKPASKHIITNWNKYEDGYAFSIYKSTGVDLNVPRNEVEFISRLM